LSPTERRTLACYVRRESTPHAWAVRARIVLACAGGKASGEVAAELGVSPQTVCKWRARFLAGRLDGLLDAPRSGAPRRISDADVSRVLRKTLEEPPPTGRHWTTRSMARTVGMSQSAISRLFRTFAIDPRTLASRPNAGRVDLWTPCTAGLGTTASLGSASQDGAEKLVAKRAIVGLYMAGRDRVLASVAREPARRVAPLQAARFAERDAARPGDALAPGQSLAAVDARLAERRRRHAPSELRRFLIRLERAAPDDREIELLFDTPGPTRTPSVQRWLARHPRFRVVYAPIAAWWMPAAERAAADTEGHLALGCDPGRAEALSHAIDAFLGTHAKTATVFAWVHADDRARVHAPQAAAAPVSVPHPSSGAVAYRATARRAGLAADRGHAGAQSRHAQHPAWTARDEDALAVFAKRP
jgi:transposase